VQKKAEAGTVNNICNNTQYLSKLFQYLKFLFTSTTADRTGDVVFKLAMKQNKQVAVTICFIFYFYYLFYYVSH